MKPLGQFFMFGIAVAFILGVTFVKESTPFSVVILLGVAITLASTLIFLRKPKHKSELKFSHDPAKGIVPGTKQWAEALYDNGFISKEELDNFLSKLPKEN